MSKRFPALLAVILLLAVTSAFAASTSTASEQPASADQNESAARVDRGDSAYVAERAIIRDSKTGSLRKPTKKELTELVNTLKTLTNRSTDNLKVTTTASGMSQMDLEGRFNMVVIARPTEDGEMETICVSTFDEAAKFLGLRPEDGGGVQ